MNPRLDPAERTALARLVPPPPEGELSADRHRVLKEAFMHEIAPAPATAPDRPTVRPRRRLVWLAVPVAATALAAVLVATVGLPGSDPGSGTPMNQYVTVLQGEAAGVAPLMEQIALVAAAKPAAPVAGGSFVYVRSKVAWLVFPDDVDDRPKEAGVDAQVLDEVHDREIWLSQAGGVSLIRERGETFKAVGAPANSTYANLPTDPEALLRHAYAVADQGDLPRDYAAFDYIGEALRESLLPPAVNAALYRAAARIPGAVLVPESVDAAGRAGVAVGRTDEFGTRTEWIFDRTSFEYLGERSYLVRDNETGKAGMLTATTAVLTRVVVDKAGKRPN
ncbi:CU044_5270 family protein [Micromonospora sp. RTGN7]|uniref:CU044_5270 family protein n=1 Tax=Micromonospora sp. RTGN7 TaxID=3016526 RepID=UPI0029FEFBB3|nr:CU044_5270 family protein [Micromonospora sp. RTGN7]